MGSAPSTLPVERSDRYYRNDKPPDQRTPFQRDRDRILYTSAFRRLGGITQVVSPTERVLVHNRLTHTLEVAQVARRLAEKLCNDPLTAEAIEAAGGVDPDVAEAAAFAHDLGHPPFGHIAEEVLNEQAHGRNLDGFNGNAQSFRIVTRLALRHYEFQGLNLTRATLDAILKYPWVSEKGKPQTKWGAYESEREEFEFARASHERASHDRSVEAEIMDWADDIAYAVHDMEDFYRVGIIPLDALITNTRERDRFLGDAHRRLSDENDATVSQESLERAFREIVYPLPIREPFRGARDQRAALRSVTSMLIERFLNAFSLKTDPQSGYRVEIEPQARLYVTLLKQLTWQYVIENPSLVTRQHGQRHIIRRLIEVLHEHMTSISSGGRSPYLLFPEHYREQLRDAAGNDERSRLVIDYIASMTEPQALHLYQRLSGAASSTYGWDE